MDIVQKSWKEDKFVFFEVLDSETWNQKNFW